MTHRLSTILALIALWSAVALLKAAIEVADGGSWSGALAVHLPVALLWLGLTPAIDRVNQIARARRWNFARATLAHVPMFVAAALLDALCTRALVVAAGGTLRAPFHVTLVYYADISLAYYVVAAMSSSAFRMHRSLIARARRELALRARLTRARLQHLEQQLQPHFLFNALGAVMELAHEAPREAGAMLRNLSSLLRYALDGTPGEEVTIAEELRALEPYLQVQRVRFADWLTLETSTDAAVANALIPRLALQPLVENAIRHGLSGRLQPGRLSIEATSHHGRVILRVQDNGVGLTRVASSSGRGIGLTVLRERLREIHGDAAELRLTEAPGGGAITEVELPLRFARVSNDLQKDTDVDLMEMSSRPASPARTALAIAGGWTFFAIFWVQQSWGYSRVRSSGGGESVLAVFQRDLPIVACWAALTPLVFAGTRALAKVSWPRWLVILMYAAAAPLFSVAHLAGLSLLRHAVPWRGWSLGLFTIDLLVFAVLVALAQRRVLEARLVERAMTAAQLEMEVVEAGLAATTQQVGSGVVLRALDALAETALHDAAAAERGLARLAELVRATLEMVGAALVRLDRELDALEAYLAVRQTALGEPVSVTVSCESDIGSPLVRPGLLRAVAEDLLEVGSSGAITLMTRNGVLVVTGSLDEKGPARNSLVARQTRTFDSPGVTVTEGADTIVVVVDDATASEAIVMASARASGAMHVRTRVA